MHFHKSLIAILAPLSILTACGGGSAPVAISTAGTIDTSSVSTSLTDCMSITPGRKFQFTSGRIFQTSNETFNAQAAAVLTELRPADGTRMEAIYSELQGGFFKSIGRVIYTAGGVYGATTTRFDDPGISLSLLPGETTTSNWTRTTVAANAASSNERGADTVSFEGQETLTLAGRTFTNACRLKIRNKGSDDLAPQNAFDSVNIVWYAKGYGPIQVLPLKTDGTPDTEKQSSIKAFL